MQKGVEVLDGWRERWLVSTSAGPSGEVGGRWSTWLIRYTLIQNKDFFFFLKKVCLYVCVYIYVYVHIDTIS